MAQDKPTGIRIPSASRQIAFHQLLVAARKTHLIDGLQEALAEVDPQAVKKELTQFAPKNAQRILARAGIRDEYVFPVPVVLCAKPSLVGYYRLLLGVPQKSFYGSGSGMSQFKSMESRGSLTQAQRQALPEFCSSMWCALSELVREISPAISGRDVNDLPLLTLGAQMQGSNNNAIGRQATLEVFLSITEIVRERQTVSTEKRIEFRNASNRKVVIELAADPDISVKEEFRDDARPKVAIEIKGGSDRSNVHNRAGEAEKSHQKAKRAGYRDFWTIIAKAGLSEKALRDESPTTTCWFDVSEVLARKGLDWDDFRSRLCGELGIPDPGTK